MIRILIADDEAPARGELAYLLGRLLPGAALHEAAGGRAALELADATPFAAAFLDITMPGLNGLAVAAALLERPEPPLIVFATAHDQFAIRAFELAALDYIVKPFDERRLAQTVARITRLLAERELAASHHQALAAYLGQQAPPALPRLWGERENENQVLVDFQSILWIEALEKKVYLRTGAGERLLVRETLRELEPRLAPHGFARSHKAYLVNLNHVAEIVPWFSGGYLLRMADAARSELPLSRRYAAALKQRAGLRG
ncbi:MAG TPA: LytTR family DNA-binding domain-containing protein [Herpetosiphonaceae bacterium]